MYIEQAWAQHNQIIAIYTRASGQDIVTNPVLLATIRAGVKGNEPSDSRIKIPLAWDTFVVNATRQEPTSPHQSEVLPPTQTAETLEELVQKARQTWTALVKECGDIISTGIDLAYKEPPVTSRLILPSRAHTPPEFTGYAALPHEIDALHAIARAIPLPSPDKGTVADNLSFGYL